MFYVIVYLYYFLKNKIFFNYYNNINMIYQNFIIFYILLIILSIIYSKLGYGGHSKPPSLL